MAVTTDGTLAGNGSGELKDRRLVERRVADQGPPAGVPDRRRSGERRESVIDRRTVPDRRLLAKAVEAIAESSVGRGVAPEMNEHDFERRRGPGRRLSDTRKAAEEGEMTPEQFLFLMAIEGFKRANGKQYPSWTDVLEVIRLLGYRKTCPSEIRLNNADDWRESADGPSNVRPKGWEQRPGRRKAA